MIEDGNSVELVVVIKAEEFKSCAITEGCCEA